MKLPSSSVAVFFFLLASLSVLSLSGCASKKPQGPDQRAGERIEELRNLVERQVEDPERAEAMFAVLDRANTEVKRQAREMDSQLEAIREASQQYDTSREELQTMLNQLEEDTLKILDVLQEAHFEMKKLATEEEWAAVIEQERKFLGIF